MYMLSGTKNTNSASPIPSGKKNDDGLYTFDKVSSFRNEASRGMTALGGARTGTANGKGRPMTSVRAAGYSSRGRTSAGTNSPFDPFMSNSSARLTQEKIVISPEDQIKDAERKVTDLIHESCIATKNGDFRGGLDKAKEAAKRERLVARQKEASSASSDPNPPPPNLDLTYCVLFNLGNHYQNCKMHQEALNTYAIIVKNKAFAQSGRLRVNMGNIFFEQQNFSQAVKMYRMALDQIPSTNKIMRLKILMNIGIAFIKMSQFADAASSFEAIMEVSPDHRAGFNLILCYYALGDRERMKKGFQKMLAIQPHLIDKSEETTINSKNEPIHDHDVFTQDSLRALSREKKKNAERSIMLAAKLIAPAIDQTFTEGYDWIVETIKTSTYSDIASELEISKAIQYLKQKDFIQAIEALKAFENKDEKLLGAAATNLSFLYFLNGELKQAEHYADIAISHDRYNAKAHTNRGNVYYQQGNFDKAREQYEEAIGLDAVSTDAMYNLALVHKKQNNIPAALQWFEKLHVILQNSAQVIFHLADIQDQAGNLQISLEWFNVLISVVPTDPGVLARLGSMFEKHGDRAQAFHYYSESFRYFPSNLDVISWLGGYYVECQVYEQAIQLFERATFIQPSQVKWHLMIASCYRRSGNYQVAFETYRRIHDKFPDNLECLRFLVRISTDLGMPVAAEYAGRLARLEGRQLDSGATPEPEAFTEFVKIRSEGVSASVRATERDNPLSTREEDWQEDVTNLLPD